MRTRLRLGLLSMLVAAMGLMLLPGTAFAQYGPSADDFVTCSPDPAAPGADVNCEAGIFEPGTEVDAEATVGETQVLDATLTAGEDGTVAFGFTIPEDAPNGRYDVTVTGADGKVLSEQLVVAPEAAEGARSPGRGLGNTGTQTASFAGAALVLLLIGGGAVYFTRRRSTTSG